MTIKPLECYDRRFLVQTDDKICYSTTKGMKLMVPGQLFGVRKSHDGRKFRFIINDEINKVFTMTDEDFYSLMNNSIPVEEAIEQGYINEE